MVFIRQKRGCEVVRGVVGWEMWMRDSFRVLGFFGFLRFLWFLRLGV